jgi:pre-rRNA-processing protein TSR3
MTDIPVHVIWLEQDDPKKNTAVRLAKKGLVTIHKKVERLPRRGIILDPLCGKVFGPEDHDLLIKGGAIVGLDCSWAQIESSVEKVTRNTKLQRRMLPLVLAANPVNWGKPSKLTTAEAIATILYLKGNEKQARNLLSKFNWGEQFFVLNEEPLKAYSSVESSSELVDLQFEFFDIEHLRE